MSRNLRAELLATGDELLTGAIADTNGALAALRLREAGIEVRRMVVTGDGQAEIERALGEAIARADFLIVSGGLGPTEDDRTSAAVAAVAGVALVRSEEALAHLQAVFAKRSLELTPNNLKQADLPQGSEILPNPVGSAVGFTLAIGGCRVFCLPGVPHEYERMLADQVLPRARDESGRRLGVRTLRLFGVSESKLEWRVRRVPLPEGVVVGYRPTWPELHLRLYAEGDGPLEPRLDKAEAAIREVVGEKLYGSGEASLAVVVGQLLAQRGWRLSLAESCTGGLLGATLTEIPGSSDWFERGYVTYSNASKVRELGVAEETLEAHGAVSQESALAMAAGALRESGADAALSVTGIAGPAGGTPEKPVGTVWIGLATASAVSARPYRFFGSRERIRLVSVWAALDRLRRLLLELPED